MKNGQVDTKKVNAPTTLQATKMALQVTSKKLEAAQAACVKLEEEAREARAKSAALAANLVIADSQVEKLTTRLDKEYSTEQKRETARKQRIEDAYLRREEARAEARTERQRNARYGFVSALLVAEVPAPVSSKDTDPSQKVEAAKAKARARFAAQTRANGYEATFEVDKLVSARTKVAEDIEVLLAGGF